MPQQHEPGEPEPALEDRIQAWKRTGDQGHLWPGIQLADRLAAHKRIADATQAVLAGAQGVYLDAVDATAVRATGIAAFSAGMGPLLGCWIERGALEAPAPLQELLAEHLRHGRQRVAKLTSELDRLLLTMSRSEITPIILKGMHTGRVYFPEPSCRVGTDIDVLVTPEELHRARAILSRAGFRETADSRPPVSSTWELGDVPQRLRSVELNHSENPWSVDLHYALSRSYSRGLRFDFGTQPFRVRESGDLFSSPVSVLGQPLLAAYLAMHASHPPQGLQLIRLVELTLVMREDFAAGRFTWAGFEDTVAEYDTGRFVYPALWCVEQIAPGTVDARLLGALGNGVPPRMQRVLDQVASSGMAYLGPVSLDAKLMWARSRRELLFHSVALLWPGSHATPFRASVRELPRRVRKALGGQLSFRARRLGGTQGKDEDDRTKSTN